MMTSPGSCKIRLVTALPFVLGMFLGTMLTVFLVLAVRSIDDSPPGNGGKQLVATAYEDIQPPSTYDEVKEIFKEPSDLNMAPRAGVSYNVLSSSKHLQSRVVPIHHTWGGNMDVSGRVSYYLQPPGGEAETKFALKNTLPLVDRKYELPSMALVKSQGVFRIWRDVCEVKSHQYKWFMKLEDNVYVKTRELERLLMSLNSSEPLLIGQSVFPTGEERERLGLKEGENYCLELGYVASWGVIKQVCPMLKRCQENARSENEDVEVARCIRIYANVNCTAAVEMRELFYKASDLYSEEELQVGEHHLNPSLKRAILLAPLNEPDHFYRLHLYYTEHYLKGVKLSAKQLRSHMISTVNLGARTDSLVYASSDNHSPLWTKMGVHPPHVPQESESVVHFQLFDYRYKYTESLHYPIHSLTRTEHKDVMEVVEVVTRSLAHSNSTLHGSPTVESVMQRFDPKRGIDYFVQVLVDVSDANNKPQSMMLHGLREAEPPHIVSLQGAGYKTTKVNFVVEAPAVSRGFQRFMVSFESSFLARSPPEAVGLLVVLYSEDGAFKRYDQDLYSVKALLDLYGRKYPQSDLRFVSTRKAHSRMETFTIASTTFPKYELLFLADIHIDFSLQFLQRCRLNTIVNKQVYFPAVFNPYNPDEYYKLRILYPHASKFRISKDRGNWMHESYHIACVYNYDLAEALKEVSNQEEGKTLLDLFISSTELTIFRSVEPGLMHMWQDGCKEEDLGKTEKSLCEKLDLLLQTS